MNYFNTPDSRTTNLMFMRSSCPEALFPNKDRYSPNYTRNDRDQSSVMKQSKEQFYSDYKRTGAVVPPSKNLYY